MGSLGNFVSVDEYLTNHGTADELRVSCLRRDYKSTLVYSRDDLNHSKLFLTNIAGALEVCNKNITSPAFEYGSSIYEKVTERSKSFDCALCADFDFPGALDILSTFCDDLQTQSNLRLVDAVVSKQFITNSLDLFGVSLSSERQSTLNEKALLAELTRFRNSVRDFALGKHLSENGSKVSKQHLKEFSKQNSELLLECDNVRAFINSLKLNNLND